MLRKSALLTGIVLSLVMLATAAQPASYRGGMTGYRGGMTGHYVRPAAMAPVRYTMPARYAAPVYRPALRYHMRPIQIGSPCIHGHRTSIPHAFQQPERRHIGPTPQVTPMPSGYYPVGRVPHTQQRPCLAV